MIFMWVVLFCCGETLGEKLGEGGSPERRALLMIFHVGDFYLLRRDGRRRSLECSGILMIPVWVICSSFCFDDGWIRARPS